MQEIGYIQPKSNFGTDVIRALLLDDDQHDRKRIQRFSKKSHMKIQIDEAPSISALTSVIDHDPFDVIILDYHLAQGNGLEALNVIQKSQSNRDTAVIMVSGSQQSKVAAAAFRSGCKDFIAKDDLSPDVLRNAVVSALSPSKPLFSTNADEFVTWVQDELRAVLRNSLETGAMQSMVSEAVRAAALEIEVSDKVFKSDEVTRLVDEFMRVDEFHFKN